MEVVDFFQSIKTPSTIVHVIGVVLGMGGALVSDMLFSFFSKDKRLNNTEIFTLSSISKLVSYSLFAIAVSGIAIFLSDPTKYIQSAKFLSKMSILSVLLINGYILNKKIWPHLLKNDFFTKERERPVRRLAFACGAVSVTSWLFVCTLGILDKVSASYISIIGLYTGILLAGILIALRIEKKELN